MIADWLAHAGPLTLELEGGARAAPPAVVPEDLGRWLRREALRSPGPGPDRDAGFYWLLLRRLAMVPFGVYLSLRLFPPEDPD